MSFETVAISGLQPEYLCFTFHMSRRGPLFLTLLLACFLTGIAANAQEEKIPLRPAVLEPVTLKQAVESSLDNNTQIKNGRIEVDITGDKIAAARTHLFPEIHLNAMGLQLLAPLNFEFNKGVFGNYKEIGPIPSEKISVTTDQKPVLFINTSMTYPISQITRIKLGIKQAELSRTIAQAKLNLQKQQTASQVRHAYYKILETQDSSKVLDSTRDLFLEIERITKNYLADKMVLPADLLDVRQQLANAEYEALKTRNLLATQKEELSRLLGRDIQLNYQVSAPQEMKSSEMDLHEAQNLALKQRAELLQASYQSQQIDLERRIRRLQQLPQVGLIVDYISIFGAQILPKNVVFAGFVLNWEPNESWRKRYEVAEQRKLYQQSQNSTKDLQAQVMMEVNSSHRALQESKQFVQVTQLGRELAVEKLRVISNKYKEKAALLKDVLQAQRDLNQADYRYTQATIALWTARADFEKAIGVE